LHVSKFFPLFITVGKVENLVASLQPSSPELSVTLQWDVPRKNREDEITAYDIRFKKKQEAAYSNERIEGGARKTITLTSSSGIAPQTTYEFGVRARIKNSEGKWKKVFGKVKKISENGF